MDGTAWRSKPSWYIVAKNDLTVHPELQRFFTKRMRATTTEADSSHSPMLSKPDLVLDVIRTAQAVHNSQVRSGAKRVKTRQVRLVFSEGVLQDDHVHGEVRYHRLQTVLEAMCFWTRRRAAVRR